MKKLISFGPQRQGRADRVAKAGVKTEPTPDKLGLLLLSDLFRDLPEEHKRRVEEMTVMTRCERGRTIYTPGESGEALFLLKQGKVHIYRLSPDGKKLLIGVVGPGMLFGDMAVTGQRMLDSFAEAVEDSLLCVMSRHDVEDFILRYPVVGIRLVDILARRVRELEARLEESSLSDMRSRVAAVLLRRYAQEGADAVTITHQELADAVGTYRETVTRTLGELQDMGLVALKRRRIRITDTTGLRELVDTDTSS